MKRILTRRIYKKIWQHFSCYPEAEREFQFQHLSRQHTFCEQDKLHYIKYPEFLTCH